MNAIDRDEAMEYLRTLVRRDADKDALADDLHPADKAEMERVRKNALGVIDPVGLQEWRTNTFLREQAHDLAAEQARRRVEAAVDSIEAMNFGEARETLRGLVENGLPNDHGGPVVSYPLFEEELAAISNRPGR
jgi:hypothetical protein